MASKVQNKTIKEWENNGYFVLNLIATNKNGIPDLLCLKENESPIFIECKESGDRVSPLQEFIHRELKKKGFTVIVQKDD